MCVVLCVLTKGLNSEDKTNERNIFYPSQKSMYMFEI